MARLSSMVLPKAKPATPNCNHNRRKTGRATEPSRSDARKSGSYPKDASRDANSLSRSTEGSKVNATSRRRKLTEESPIPGRSRNTCSKSHTQATQWMAGTRKVTRVRRSSE